MSVTKNNSKVSKNQALIVVDANPAEEADSVIRKGVRVKPQTYTKPLTKTELLAKEKDATLPSLVEEVESGSQHEATTDAHLTYSQQAEQARAKMAMEGRKPIMGKGSGKSPASRSNTWSVKGRGADIKLPSVDRSQRHGKGRPQPSARKEFQMWGLQQSSIVDQIPHVTYLTSTAKASDPDVPIKTKIRNHLVVNWSNAGYLNESLSALAQFSPKFEAVYNHSYQTAAHIYSAHKRRLSGKLQTAKFEADAAGVADALFMLCALALTDPFEDGYVTIIPDSVAPKPEPDTFAYAIRAWIKTHYSKNLKIAVDSKETYNIVLRVIPVPSSQGSDDLNSK